MPDSPQTAQSGLVNDEIAILASRPITARPKSQFSPGEKDVNYV
jgi:hypothetical protein